MKVSTIALLANAAVFVGVGIWCIADPHGALEPVGVKASAKGATELRAMYGGLELGVAGFLIACARRPAWQAAGLLLCGSALLGLGLTRTLSGVATGTFNGLHPLLAASEIGGAAINLLVCRRAMSSTA